MQKITQLKNNKTNNRISVFLDTKFWVSISESDVLDFELYKGKEINAILKNRVEDASNFSYNLSRIRKYIARRPRSKFEVSDYINRKLDAEDDQHQALISKLETEELIDDQKFANWFIDSRVEYSNKGINRIRAELMKKRVSGTVIDLAINKLDEERVKSQAKNKITTEVEKFLNKQSEQLGLYDKPIQKLVRRLVSRGFSFSDIKEILSEHNIN